jgi:Domain of unknown function (DUF6946)
MTVRIENRSGDEITTLKEWESMYATPQLKKQWVQHRSAYSVAEFLLNHGGGEAIRSRVSEVLGCSVEFERAIPEYEFRFDEYGRGRVHDLGVFGHTETGKSLFIGVEAKVDEPFGSSVRDSYLRAKAKQIVGVATNAPERIEDLLALHFSEPDPTMFDLRYQLLYATAGTLAVETDIHLLYVAVFKTPLYNESIGVENYRDYIQFMEKVGAVSLRLPTKEIVAHTLNLRGSELICLHEYFQL